MTISEDINSKNQEKNFIIELVGPAGSGKSTLLKAFDQSNEKIAQTVPPNLNFSLTINNIYNGFFLSKN